MKKGNLIALSILGLLLTPIVLTSIALAQDAPKRVVMQDVADVGNIYKVSASQTSSGFPVPRYVSLKFNKVNGRRGPSLEQPVLWQYQRRGLPLIIVAETDMWRKVRDINGDESWVRKPALSGERTVIVLDDTDLHAKPHETSKVTAVANRNAVLHLEQCQDEGYCKVRSGNGHKGWVPRYKLWGTTNLN